jgi:DNA-binding response OmpR family regulator
MKILLVEDEAALADVIARNFRARGFKTTVAGTAEAALLEMAASWPDVIVLDVNLPDLTGWEILRRLTAADRQRVGVIVISAAPIAQKRIQEFQPLRWLQKPFPMDALVRLVGEASATSQPPAEVDRQ